MRKFALLALVAILGAMAPVSAAAVDYKNLPMGVQEEIGVLWLRNAIWEGQQLAAIDTIPQFIEYRENIDSFDALYEAATLTSDQKAFVGYLVYANRVAMYGRLAKIDGQRLVRISGTKDEVARATERWESAEPVFNQLLGSKGIKCTTHC